MERVARNMRPALYFALRLTETSIDTMRVTRLTPSRIYGSVDAISTHCATSQLFGCYDEEADANRERTRICMMLANADDRIDGLRREIRQLRESRERTMVTMLERLNKCK